MSAVPRTMNRKLRCGSAVIRREPRRSEGKMRWLLRGMVSIGLATLLVGCGSGGFDTENGGDQLVLSFQGFSGEGLDQADFVGSTSADVDVCQFFCIQTDVIQQSLEQEPYTSTRAMATFGNTGKSDILIDRYTVTLPGSGIPERVSAISERVAGGRCSSGLACASDRDCESGTCDHESSAFEILLIDQTTKDLLRSGTCPTVTLNPITITPGDIVPETLPIQVRFSGSDNTGERFNLSAGYEAVFYNFDNCMNTNTN